MNKPNIDFNKIKLLISDVDGVLTNGTVFIGNQGMEFKQFSIHDGMGTALAKAADLPLALISGRFSESTERRAKELKIDDIYNGALNKLIPYEELKNKFQLQDDEIAYIGDDLIDIPVMKKVSFPVAVNDAFPEVKDVAKYITDVRGGEGVLREVIVKILKEQGRYESVMERLITLVFENPDFEK